MPDPRTQRIDIGPFHLSAVPDTARWRMDADRGADGVASGVEGAWNDWVAFAQRVLQVDGLWREIEARGDAWDQGHAASGDTAASNPYR